MANKPAKINLNNEVKNNTQMGKPQIKKKKPLYKNLVRLILTAKHILTKYQIHEKI